MPGPWPLDDGTADRIVSGFMSADDAPPGYRDATQLVEALQAQATAEELRNAERAAADLSAEIRLRPVYRPRARVRLAVAAAVCVGVAFGSLAVAGALPRPAQSLTSTILHQIGVSVPAPDSPSQTVHVDAGTDSGSGTQTDQPSSDNGASDSKPNTNSARTETPAPDVTSVTSPAAATSTTKPPGRDAPKAPPGPGDTKAPDPRH
jgi:hypothetical protein